VVVRAVDVDEPLAGARERLQRGRGAVDELAVGSRGGEHALEEELSLVARFDAVFVEERSQGSLELPHVNGGFDRAALFAATDERAVGALAQDEIERADEDGFARAGLATDDVQARLELEREVGDEGEVLDAERGQHREILRPDFGVCGSVPQKKSVNLNKLQDQSSKLQKSFIIQFPMTGLGQVSDLEPGLWDLELLWNFEL